MMRNQITDLSPIGLALFSDLDSFMNDLSEDNEAMITGGRRSGVSRSTNSRTRRRRRRRRGGNRSRT